MNLYVSIYWQTAEALSTTIRVLEQYLLHRILNNQSNYLLITLKW